MSFFDALNTIPGYIAIAACIAGWAMIIHEFAFGRKPPQPTPRDELLQAVGIDEDDVVEDGEAAELMFKRG